MSAKFPGRPDHPDFWLLSQAILDLDAQADAGQQTTDIIARYIQPGAVIYMARQRAFLAMGGKPAAGHATVSAAWIDGFLAGMMAQHLKAIPDAGPHGWSES